MAIGMPMIRPQITKKYCIDSAPRVAAGSPRRRLFQFWNNGKAANNTRPACNTQNQTASESISQRFMHDVCSNRRCHPSRIIHHPPIIGDSSARIMSDGERFVVRANEKLMVVYEIESAKDVRWEKMHGDWF
jgi:hypothetical protein